MTPATEAELADIVRDASAKNRTLEIVGQGTKRALGRQAPCDDTLDTSLLTGIVTYEPEELVLIVRAGTPVAEIQAALAEKNQMLAFAPADWGPLFGEPPARAALGGIVATDACGSRRVFAGGVRDSLLGCRFVNGAGEIIRAGSRVMKNVTGFDIPKLMCGAFATLGALTELTFKVAPKPARTAAIALKNLAVGDAFTALRRAAQLPLEVTGLAYLPKNALALSPSGRDAGLSGVRGAAFVRVEGAPEPLAAKLEHLVREFKGRDIAVLGEDVTEMLFAEIGNASLFAGADGDVWRLCVPPSEAATALDVAKPASWSADWAGGLLWLGLPATQETAERLRDITARTGGHATLVRAPADARTRLPVFEPEPPARAHLTRQVKLAFDANRVLNPGRMYEDV